MEIKDIIKEAEKTELTNQEKFDILLKCLEACEEIIKILSNHSE